MAGVGEQLLLEARAVERHFQDGPRVLRVLRGVDLSVRSGESVAIMGPSGAGKSTLLHLLAGIDRPTRGTIVFNSTDLTMMDNESLARFCNRTIAIIFQFYHLLAEFSALENVMMPGLISGARRRQLHERAIRLLEAVGLADRLSHRPSKLSGGEQQRVAIARALINDPALILADEPTGNLDEQTGRTVIDLLWRETVGLGKTLVIVTHEPSIARRADRCFLLSEGHLHPLPESTNM